MNREEVSMNANRASRRRLVQPAISGQQIVALMRKHRVTIRELSRRMQITQKRIRQVRERGLDHPGFARDWIEHITGTDPGPHPDVASLLAPKT
jgi:hypothetical protein